MEHRDDIIVAPATLSGGAIAVVRLSGEGSIALMDIIFRPKSGHSLQESKGYTLHYGYIVDGEDVIDDVMVSLYVAPHSYTSEDSVEISCHGSSYIVEQIIELTLRQGARMATAGEFTTRAFLAGKIDLSQAEAVADMIGATSRATHTLASTQMRGGYSAELEMLRGELVELCALLELELDFSEEDVEFADRSRLNGLMERLESQIDRLYDSFRLGNVLKQGVAVAIIGAPNAGKSTLLNRLIGDDRAMVSEIAGTTRDTIEEMINIDGVNYRFIDTAGLHSTNDQLEQMGIARTYEAISKADVVIQLVDLCDADSFERVEVRADQRLIVAINKCDLGDSDKLGDDYLHLSARSGEGVKELIEELGRGIDTEGLYRGDTIVSNARHYSHLSSARESLSHAHTALKESLPTELVTNDLRHTLHHIGSITGTITTDDILSKIFSSFCIGK